MGIVNEISERHLSLPIGAGIMIAALSAAPKLIKAAKPMIKGAIKGYLVVSAKAREMTAEAIEQFQDLYAETKYEFEHQCEKTAQLKMDEQNEPEKKESVSPEKKQTSKSHHQDSGQLHPNE